MTWRWYPAGLGHPCDDTEPTARVLEMGRLHVVRLGLLLSTVAVLGCGSGATGAVQPKPTPPPQCTVQMSGHEMFASAKGIGAPAACTAWKRSGHPGTATGDDVCKYSYAKLSVQVRDAGLHIYGDPICAALKTWSAKGGPVAS
jgi:hypothetical protein